MKAEKNVKIGDFLTPQEIKRAEVIYRECNGSGFAKKVSAEIIEPNIDRINKAVGQKCLPLYLAYAVEYAMLQANR